MTDRSAPGGTQRVPVRTHLRARPVTSGQTLSRAGFGFVRASLFLASLWLASGSAALAAVPGAGSVSNQATVTFDSDAGRQEAPTNTVTIGLTPAPPPPPPPPPPAACTPVLAPSGTVDAPAQTLSGAPGETVLVPYTLTQTGAGGVIDLELAVLTGVPAPDATLFLDLNGDGTLGEGEGEINSLELAAGASVNLLVQATLGEPAPSDVILELIARCEGEPGNLSRSVSLITVETIPPPPSLLPILSKDADPPSGSAVVTGQELRYTLSFTAGSQALTDLVVSDTLSDALGDPALVTDGTVTDPGTGLETTAVAAFDPATRTLSWTFAEVPALMRVVLEFSVTVAETAPPGAVPNQAELTFANDPDSPSALSNVVVHTVADTPAPPAPEPGPPLPTLVKGAVPAPGTDVVPLQEITYNLTFSAGDEPLSGVQVSDTLSAALGGPVDVTDGTVTDPETGLSATAAATYDPATRELMWTFAEVPATMTVALSFSVTVAPDATGVVTNQAELTTGGMTSLSSAVTHTITIDAPTPPPSPEPCNVFATPDGSEAAPGQQRTVQPGGVALLPYTLTQTGAATAPVTLTATSLPGNAVTPEITVFADDNGNGVVDTGEAALTGLELGSGASADLLVAVTVPPEPPVPTDLLVNLVATCEGDAALVAGATDADNVASVQVSADGGTPPAPPAPPETPVDPAPPAPVPPTPVPPTPPGPTPPNPAPVPPTPSPTPPPGPTPTFPLLTKVASPPSGSVVAAGQQLTYTLSFSAGSEALGGVTVTDTLDGALGDPALVTNGTVVDPATGLQTTAAASYDAATHTLTWTLADVPATMTVTLAFSAAAPATGVVDNQAELTIGGDTALSNEVAHAVAETPLQPCLLSVTPDGTVQLPGQEQTGFPGDVVNLPYILTNTGGAVSSYSVAPVIDGSSSWRAAGVGVILDADGDGEADAGEPGVATLNLDAGESAALLLTLTLDEARAVSGGELYVGLTGACVGGGGADVGNVARVTVPAGGLVTPPEKRAAPPAGTPLYPGATVRYTVSFTAGARPLKNVRVIDPLSEFLEDPNFYTEGTVTDAAGRVAAATATYSDRTVTWSLAEVPAGMTVTLDLVATVRADAPTGATLSNRARLTSDLLDTPTAEVTHPLRGFELRLEKTATPAEVGVGEEVTYTLQTLNPSEVAPLTGLVLRDPLPESLRYVPGSSLLFTDDPEEAGAVPLEPDISGDTLTWTLPDLGPGEMLSVEFRATLLPGSSSAQIVTNRATLSGSSRGVAAEAEDAAVVAVVANVFTERATLAGTAFVDENGNGALDGSDTPVEGLRLYLSNGQSFVTDSRGRYTFVNLAPGLAALRVDATTQPPFALQESVTQVGEGFWRLRLLSGLITRQDVAFVPPDVSSAVSQTLKLGDGPVSLGKTLTPLGEDRFEVTLTLSTTDALNGLTVSDSLPPDSSLETPPQNPATGALAPDLSLNLGDVPAGFETRVVYTLRLAPSQNNSSQNNSSQNNVPPVTTVPTLRWEEP